MPAAEYRLLFKKIPALWDLVHEKGYDKDDHSLATAIEFVLEGLTALQKLSRRRLGDLSSFKSVDIY